MDQIGFGLLLDYLYNRFAVTCIVSIIGCSIRELAGSMSSKKKISINKLIASTLFSTVLMCAVGEHIKMVFSVYVLSCVIVGIWSSTLINLVMNKKFMAKLTSTVFKTAADKVLRATGEAIDDYIESEDNKKKQDKNSSKKE